MKKILVYITGMIGLFSMKISAQDAALKTNGLFWVATTPNIGLEVALSTRITLDLFGAYNPWTFKDDKKMRFWLAQPEVRYWLCEKFQGHFLGLHAHGAQYFGGFSHKRYDGYLAGGGFTYGYNWILSPRWNLEAALGIGYARLWYKESERIPCKTCPENKYKNYFGPTKAALSILYIF